MTAPTFSVAELLALDPADLAGLVDMCPGDYVSSRAAVLGLDVEVPEHHRALRRAFPDAFTGLDGPVSAGQDGVRVTLTPESAPAPDSDTGNPPGVDDTHRGAEPAPAELDIVGLLDAYRGSREPFLAGTFAMYSAPDGSIVIVTEMPDRGVEQRAVPGQLVRMALNAAMGKGALVGKLFGRGH